MIRIICRDNLEVLQQIPDDSIDLIYIDPPFNTGKVQKRTSLKTVRDKKGSRVGFQGQRYSTKTLGCSIKFSGGIHF